MAIQALPNTTVRALGASQVLTDPAAVVKELVDNALDARATSVAIEISSNTTDSIQVRDTAMASRRKTGNWWQGHIVRARSAAKMI